MTVLYIILEVYVCSCDVEVVIFYNHQHLKIFHTVVSLSESMCPVTHKEVLFSAECTSIIRCNCVTGGQLNPGVTIPLKD